MKSVTQMQTVPRRLHDQGPQNKLLCAAETSPTNDGLWIGPIEVDNYPKCVGNYCLRYNDRSAGEQLTSTRCPVTIEVDFVKKNYKFFNCIGRNVMIIHFQFKCTQIK